MEELEVREEERKEGEGGWKVAFWNVAGLGKKDRNFWKGLRDWDVVVMSETWVDEKGWGKIKSRLPDGYVWESQPAFKRNRKGRAIGGMVMGIRKEVIERELKIESGKEGVMVGRVIQGKEKWRIVGVYASGGIEKTLQNIGQWVEGKEEDIKTIIGGDLNARTGWEGGGVVMEEEDFRSEGKRLRKSKDGKINKEGRRLIEFLEERGWGILNGCTNGDEEGEYTFTGGKGCTVIDYVLGDEEVRDKIRCFKVGDKVDSDHHPVEVVIEGEVKRKRERERGRKQWKGMWNEERCETFGKKLGGGRVRGKRN